jgi:uncharacterized protein YjbJ (UPF0337 family)
LDPRSEAGICIGPSTRGGSNVDKDRVEGNAKEGWGKAKEEWGDLTDDPKTEMEGKKDQAEGELQEDWGKVKDTARDAIDDEE